MAGPLAGIRVLDPSRVMVGIEYHKAPPLLGEDTDRIIPDRLGYSAVEIERLRAQNVIQ